MLPCSFLGFCQTRLDSPPASSFVDFTRKERHSETPPRAADLRTASDPALADSLTAFWASETAPLILFQQILH